MQRQQMLPTKAGTTEISTRETALTETDKIHPGRLTHTHYGHELFHLPLC